MAGSEAERELREAVVARLRELVPEARIVHELNVAGQGTNRIDVAAVTANAIIAVELKSQKDKLDRLDQQWPAFQKCCHHVIVAAHEKHFAQFKEATWRDEVEPYTDLNHPIFFGKYSERRHVWRYPRPAPQRFERESWMIPGYFEKSAWNFPLRSSALLEMLWAEELHDESARHRIPIGSRATRGRMIHMMAEGMTGREVRQAVCRQLRARTFAAADPTVPIPNLVPQAVPA